MALPTLRPYYITRQGQPRVESVLARRHNNEADRKQRWEENARYFANSDMRSSKQQAWTSSRSFMDSMTAYESRGKMDEKRQLLKERRERLAALLASEREMFEEELRDTGSSRLTHMKHRAEQLKTHRIEQDKKVAEEKLHEHWRTNCPEMRKVEAEKTQQAVVEEWRDQVERRQREMESARQEKERYDLAMEEERLAALRIEDELQARKKEAESEHVRSLQQQMAEIKSQEKEAAALEKQQAALLQEQMELFDAEEQRKQLEEAQKKTNIGRVLLRQHKAQMKRKSRQVQEALELDMKILEDLIIKEQENLSIQTARRDRAKADVEWMKQVVADQIELEKKREEEFELLYQEEAARMWRMRESEWERERQARDRLMAEVLTERQKQIDMKMEVVKEQQAESIQQREDLLREIELVTQRSALEAREREREKVLRNEELAYQVVEKKRQARRESEIKDAEIERQRVMEEDYDHYLRGQELQLKEERYSPKFHGRRKHAWY